jgi:hypothetical protein
MSKHKERVDLYSATDAGVLVDAYTRVLNTVKHSAAEVEQYPSTPYSTTNAERLAAQTQALGVIGDELRKWHEFLYPLPTER